MQMSSSKATTFTDAQLAEQENTETEQQNRRIFQIYSIYRLGLSLVLLFSFFSRLPTSLLGVIDPSLFLQLCIIYAVLNIGILVVPLLGQGNGISNRHYLVTLFIDIVLLVMISYTSGGVRSGMAHLLVIPIAAGSMMYNIRISTFFAAIATIATGYSEVYLYLSIPNFPDDYFQAGLLGVLLFLVALTLQYLSSKIRQKEMINLRQAANIQSLMAINQKIIERMQTGIIVVDENADVLNCNSSAKRLLGFQEDSPALPAVLRSQLDNWRRNHFWQEEPFRIAGNAPELQASFAFLNAEADPTSLIFLEDNTQMSSRAQHLKLMSLGRLTASIAHEIRNPLGAISHACQLLEESPLATGEENRLLSIINTHTSRVNLIIKNILELSRNQQELPEALLLNPWVENFHSRFCNSYKEDIDFEVEFQVDPGAIQFIPGQLEQLLTNLCDNGLRYSFLTTGRRFVRAEIKIDEASGQPCIDIIDAGPGVPDDEIDQIFEPFFTTEINGTGLGLFICKEICEANQARLFFSRTDDGRSRFRTIFTGQKQLIQ